MPTKIPGIKILSSGLASSFQDSGRTGFAHLGIPKSGVMDLESQYIANALLSKPLNSSVLEMTGMGISFEVETDMVIALTGGTLEVLVNETSYPMYESLFLRAKDIVKLGTITKGLRSTMAISHEIVLENVFNSESTYCLSGFGGFKGRNLKAQDLIYIKENKLPDLYKYDLEPSEQKKIRVILSYENEDFDTSIFFSNPFQVTSDISRMGMRLSGPKLTAKDGHDIISSPVCPGTIQIPGSGQPIILLQDGQTTGGYKRIGCVAFSDLYKLSQVKPGDTLSFEAITIKEGRLYKDQWLESLESILSRRIAIKAYKLKVDGKTFYASVEERE